MARNGISNTLIKSKQNSRIREVIEVSCKIEPLSRVRMRINGSRWKNGAHEKVSIFSNL
jgi:hypothetical protein